VPEGRQEVRPDPPSDRDAAFHSDGRELRIDPQAIRQPTLTARSAGHAIDRSHQLEAASNLFAIRSAEVSHHAPAVMRDVLELRTHVVQTLLMPDRACEPSSSVKVLVIWKN
jgi:hypothetical protein